MDAVGAKVDVATGGGAFVGAVAQGIPDAKGSESHLVQVLATALHEHEQFESLLCDLVNRFNGLLGDVDVEIDHAMLRLIALLDVDRSCFAEITADDNLVLTHCVTTGNVQSYPLGVADDRLPWLVSEMRARRVVALENIPGDVPAEGAAEGAAWAASGMKSGVAIPLAIENVNVCVLIFSAFRHHRAWPASLLRRLTVIGEVFANAIARRQAREKMQRKQQELNHLGRVVAMSELASVIAHELDQPLTAIMTNAQAMRHLLMKKPPELAESFAALDDIVADTTRASQIVQRERRLLRKGEGTTEQLDLNAVIGEMELFIRADARQRRCRSAIELAAQELPVFGDRVQLQQVLLNLARNGIQAMNEVPRDDRLLIVRTASGEGEVMVEVEDRGPRIGDVQLARLFEPFFTTKTNGLGMGLSISRTIIQAHHGRMWATRNPQAGLTLHIALPKKVEGSHETDRPGRRR